MIARTEVDTALTGARVRAEPARWLLTRDFSLIWWSQVLSQVADGVTRLALLWFMYSVTGSALKTSVIGLLQTLPPIVLGPVIGVAVDRLPKKAILIITDLARGILIGLIPCWLSMESFSVEMVYLLVFLYGIATAMFVPTLSSSVPFLVERPRFVAANALLQSTTSIGIIIGPVLSGLGIAVSGSREVLCANTVIYFASALCLLPIRLPWNQLAQATRRSGAAAVQDIMESVRYAVRSQPAIAMLILMASIYTFGTGAFTTLFPVFGKKLLSLGPVEVGYLWSWLGVGFFLVSLVLVRLTRWDTRQRLHAVAVSSAMAGAALCSLVWVHSVMAATVLVAIIGMGFGAWTPVAWGLIQEFSPAHLVGRVMAIYTAIATATSMVGITFFGWLTERADEYITVIGIGIVLFVLGAVAAGFSRRMGDSVKVEPPA